MKDGGKISPRRICGCIRRVGRHLGLGHGYSELVHKSVSGIVRKPG
jgi:hypothetical protein